MAEKEKKPAKTEEAPAEKRRPIAKPSQKAIVKKRWVSIVAPKLFNEQIIGESYLAEPDLAIGKTVQVSMMALTGEPQKQSLNLKFKIINRVGEKLMTDIVEYQISPAAVRRMGRRGKARVEESMRVVTSDGKILRVKPFLIARGRPKGAVMANVRKTIRQRLPILVAKVTLEGFFDEILSYRMQRTLADSVRKIYPIALSEIRWAKILPGTEVPPVFAENAVKQEAKPEQAQETAEQQQSAETSQEQPAEDSQEQPVIEAAAEQTE